MGPKRKGGIRWTAHVHGSRGRDKERRRERERKRERERRRGRERRRETEEKSAGKLQRGKFGHLMHSIRSPPTPPPLPLPLP